MEKAIITKEKLSKTLLDKQEAAFSYDIHYPVIQWENKKTMDYVNGYSKTMAEDLLKKLEKQRRENGKKANSLIFWRRFEVSCNQKGFLSFLMLDQSRAGYSAPKHIRLSSDNWDLNTGSYLTLSNLFSPACGWRRIILSNVIMQVGEKIRKEGKKYYDRYPSLVRDHFDPDRFYLTGRSLELYYQPGELTAEEEGPQVFSIPFQAFSGQMKAKIG